MNRRISDRAMTLARNVAIFMMVLFVAGKVYLSSCEARTNMKIKKAQDEIALLTSKIDALEIEKQDLVAFARIQKVATANGLQYEQSSVVATIVEDNND
ncbi:MAG: hypothetical protein J6P61_08495 [Erysipelotrichaceae bacterium]|nr:hypothetical protein [Erysipelotrichaceae bacterium]